MMIKITAIKTISVRHSKKCNSASCSEECRIVSYQKKYNTASHFDEQMNIKTLSVCSPNEPLTVCYSKESLTVCHPEERFPVCHPEERSDEGIHKKLIRKKTI